MHFAALKIGTDVEVFLKHRVSDLPVPVCGILGGTKAKPRPLPELGNGFCIQEDNVMAEFNIPATKRLSEWIDSLRAMHYWFQQTLLPLDLDIVIKPSMVFSFSQLESKQAQTFGCDPDYCAWTLSENEVDTNNPLLRRLRTAGGHLHVSFVVNNRPPELEEALIVVKALDLFLGVPSIILDNDQRRRQFYGKAGAFRIKEYPNGAAGIEYRVLSNFWFQTEVYQRWAFQQIWKALEWLNHSPATAESRLEQLQMLIQGTINHGNKEQAFELVKEWNLRLPDSMTHPSSILETGVLSSEFLTPEAAIFTIHNDSDEMDEDGVENDESDSDENEGDDDSNS